MRKLFLLAACLAFLITMNALGAARPEPPPFNEVRDLIRTNATSLTPAELNRAAVEGLLSKLPSYAWLLDDAQPSSTDTNTVALAATAIFDDSYGYLRIGRIGAELPEQFSRALKQMAATNTLKGLAIDLRFTTGTNYEVVAAVASEFLPREQKLFEWAGGVTSSKERTNAFRAPVTVLVNRFTAGAAEALAAVLRATDVALLIGTNTAGQASATKDFNLGNGQVLRVATQPVKLANGDAITSLTPDIIVEVTPEEERAYFVDAYRMMPRSGMEGTSTNLASLSITNRGPRKRINEAELVRLSRDGIDPEEETRPARAATPAKPTIADPALARAVDLLKALAVVRHTRF
jgi:hypothetical protein